MQEFILRIRVTANTLESVSTSEIEKAISEILDDYDGGVISVESCEEL